MQLIDGRVIYAASDLNNYLECRVLTKLDRDVVRGVRQPPVHEDPTRELLARKGDEYEKHYLGTLQRTCGGSITSLARPAHDIEAFRAAQAATIAAMEAGDRLIYQGTFFDQTFLGHPDFLRRVDTPCERWPWSYEVIDTKLASSAKPYFVLQLCNYSEHLARIQGRMPQYGYIVFGDGEERAFRLDAYTSYYRHVKRRFLAYAQAQSDDYPHKCGHCNICKWSRDCAARRMADDHLSLVAWMRRGQIAKFNSGGIETLSDLALASDDARPQGMSAHTFVRLRRQAALQRRGRSEGPVYQIVPHEPWEGFGLLPQPALGDVFFDVEGDPLYEPTRGLEYLFGVYTESAAGAPEYRAFWAHTREEEKQAFEAFVDFVVDRARTFPGMHVYHYADYEKSALRRLAQAWCTREREVDDLLRAEIFVDLFAVVRQALVISEDSYSLKRLEKFYPLVRLTEVKKGDESIVMFERWLADRSDTTILQDIERYNEDDCRSTHLLREWLLERRAEASALPGAQILFRQPKLQCHPQPVDGCKTCADRRKAEREAGNTSQLQRRLLDPVLTPQSEQEYAAMSIDHRARYLLANLIAYHRREEKPVWWAFFDRCENTDRLLEFDRDAIAGLKLCDDYPATREAKSWLYTYSFPDQPYKLAAGDAVYDPATGKAAGTIFALDDQANLLTLKTTADAQRADAIQALIPKGPHRTDEQKAAVIRVAESYLAGRCTGATLDLLLARDPSLTGEPGGVLQPAVITAASVSALAQRLDGSYLFIQGPPGTGKTTIGSHVICDLLAAGQRVGVLSNSHKAIHNLLHKVETCAQTRGARFTGYYKYSKDNAESRYASYLLDPMIVSHSDNEDFEGKNYQLGAGTSWLFSRASLAGAFDYLFIDEAGQISLADALAVCAAARNVVLLGDPLQLAQVSAGNHPLHAGNSILEHLLGSARTVPPHRGIFLDTSYRMHPGVSAFISAAVYEGRLRAGKQTEQQAIQSAGFAGAGLRYAGIEHAGNSRESIEEAQYISDQIRLLLAGTVTDEDGVTRAARQSDIIVVTPYNAQRRLITKLLAQAGVDVRVGTVDKFQGQEAYVVFYSMATSSGVDIPRDIDFLFEPNRFNVAISRARAMSVLVCSPRLLDVACTTPEQVASVSLLCSFVERAEYAASLSGGPGQRTLAPRETRSIAHIALLDRLVHE